MNLRTKGEPVDHSLIEVWIIDKCCVTTIPRMKSTGKSIVDKNLTCSNFEDIKAERNFFNPTATEKNKALKRRKLVSYSSSSSSSWLITKSEGRDTLMTT